MATSTLDILKAIAPEFASKATADLNLFLELAAARLSATVWGRYYQQGVAYLAAHMLELSTREGAAGPIQSEQAGQVSRSYGPFQHPSHYGATGYGDEFLNIRRQVPGINPLTTSPYIDFGADDVQ